MAQSIKSTVAAFAILYIAALPTQAQNFEDGTAAFLAGDFAAALSHWRPLAQKGHARAQAALGKMHEYGRGLERNDAEAIRWYGKSAAQGFAVAQYRLGVLNDNGWGIPVNDTEAARWYQLAAVQGHGLAQHDLAFMYADGTGVPQDFVRAYMWLQIAVAQGNDVMIKHRNRIAGELSVAQIDEAQALARDWLAANQQ